MSEEYDESDTQDDSEQPSEVWVAQAFGREGSDEVYRAIGAVCEKLDLTARRAHPSEILGSHTTDAVVSELVSIAHFAILDLTHERPSVAHEIGLADATLPRSFILLIAKTGTPRFGNIQDRTVHYYADIAELKRMVKAQLEAMLDAWDDEYAEDGEDDEDDEATDEVEDEGEEGVEEEEGDDDADDDEDEDEFENEDE